LAKETDKEMNCGYAAAGYCLVLQQLKTDDPRQNELADKAIELIRKLIGHGYQDFRALRKTDVDFAVLQSNNDYVKMLDEEETKLAELTKP
ncbi:MAG: hypothetical protein WBD20_11300, partial [Pirellulaceae bacterium]